MLKDTIAHFGGKVRVGIGVTNNIGRFYHVYLRRVGLMWSLFLIGYLYWSAIWQNLLTKQTNTKTHTYSNLLEYVCLQKASHGL